MVLMKVLPKVKQGGSHHKSLEIAKKMMAKGMDENTIMEITGLTQEEIRKLIS